MRGSRWTCALPAAAFAVAVVIVVTAPPARAALWLELRPAAAAPGEVVHGRTGGQAAMGPPSPGTSASRSSSSSCWSVAGSWSGLWVTLRSYGPDHHGAGDAADAAGAARAVRHPRRRRLLQLCQPRATARVGSHGGRGRLAATRAPI